MGSLKAASFYSCAVWALGSVSTLHAFPHTGIVQLSAGRDNTCAVMADHHVSCWGDSGVASGLSPLPVPSITSAVAVTSGYNFACALLVDATVSCWGSNAHGQLGDGTTTYRPIAPVQVRFRRISDGLLTHVTAISAGGAHVCALREDAAESNNYAPWCWGSNSHGQIGNWSIAAGNDTLNPVDVAIHETTGVLTQLTNVSSISAGLEHTCAIFGHGDNSMACWGEKSYGRLGDGDGVTATSTPINTPIGVMAPDGSNLRASALGLISTGDLHTCAVLPEAGAVESSIACWGDNFSGELGNSYMFGDATSVPVPVVYSDGSKLTYVSSLTAGDGFSCALLKSDSSIACWGSDDLGQLGNNFEKAGYSVSPIAVASAGSAITGFNQVAAGSNHVCGLLGTRVLCWGANNYGQLGIGSADSAAHALPVNVPVDAPIFADNLDGN